MFTEHHSSRQTLLRVARNRTVRMLAGAMVGVALTVPLIAVSGFAVLTGQTEGRCGGGTLEGVPGGLAGGSVAAGMFAAPLRMRRGRWYEVGATEYGGPGDPSSGEYGAIPVAGQSFLPAHPDSFAELSLLDSNPADRGETFTFADANALDNLPYLTSLRVSHDGRSLVLAKRDIGYGQGPGQTIADGEPYRLDVWWQAAAQLGIGKSAVRIELAPESGAGNLWRDPLRSVRSL